MQLNNTFELSMILDSEKFHKVLTRAFSNSDYLEEHDGEYIDSSLSEKGIKVTYRESQYKKRVRLLVNPSIVLDSDEPDPDRLIRKLEKHVNEYFGFKYGLGDFNLTGMVLTADINVSTHDDVLAYLKVLQRIGKVKGFSPVNYDCFEECGSFSLEGNSNAVDFMIYDLEGLLVSQLRNADTGRKKLKSMIDESRGILRAEVRLTEPKAIRACTDKTDTSKQIADLSEKAEDIFMGTFTQIIPFGDFVKKDKAVEIVRREVKDNILKRKMLYLLELIPEKKSLLLAQKALNYRKIDDLMNTFVTLDLSPVTLSKRHDVKHLTNLYTYL